jgi:hypothetical protein
MLSAGKLFFTKKQPKCGESEETTPKVSKNYSRSNEDDATHTNWGLLRMIVAANKTNWGAQ